MIRLRGGSGLGDSLYLRPIVQHLRAQGKPVTVMTEYPEAFDGTGALTERFNRIGITLVAHYPHGKNNPLTNQWQDILSSCKLDVPLRFTWNIHNEHKVQRVKFIARDRPIVLVIGGREPMGRHDGFGKELLPTELAFKYVLSGLEDCLTVRIGKGPTAYSVETRLDMTDRTTVPELMDLASICDGIVGQCSYAVPLAEGFDKPFLGIWARKGLQSNVPYIKAITPQKILSKPTSRFVIDDWPARALNHAALLFMDGQRVIDAAME